MKKRIVIISILFVLLVIASYFVICDSPEMIASLTALFEAAFPEGQ